MIGDVFVDDGDRVVELYACRAFPDGDGAYGVCCVESVALCFKGVIIDTGCKVGVDIGFKCLLDVLECRGVADRHVVCLLVVPVGGWASSRDGC